jgi:hypothetical protein
MEDEQAFLNKLRVSIYPDSVVESGVDMIYAGIAPGLVAVLTRDLGDDVGTVTPAEAESLNLPVSQLFDIGLDNIMETGIFAVQLPAEDEKQRLHMIYDDEPFAATHILFLKGYCESELGAFVGVPTRRHLFFHEITDMSFVASLVALVRIQRELTGDPAPVTAGIYWHSPDNKLLPIFYEFSGGKINLQLPDELEEKLGVKSTQLRSLALGN